MPPAPPSILLCCSRGRCPRKPPAAERARRRGVFHGIVAFSRGFPGVSALLCDQAFVDKIRLNVDFYCKFADIFVPLYYIYKVSVLPQSYVVFMALLLSLFSDAEMKGEGVDSFSPAGVVSSFHSEAISPSSGEVLDPCKSCPLCGLCDDDYCAMLCHPIDMAHAPSNRGWRVFGIY